MPDATSQERVRLPRTAPPRTGTRRSALLIPVDLSKELSAPQVFRSFLPVRSDWRVERGLAGAAGNAERIKRGEGGGRKTSGTAAAKKESRGEHVTKSAPPGRETGPPGLLIPVDQEKSSPTATTGEGEAATRGEGRGGRSRSGVNGGMVAGDGAGRAIGRTNGVLAWKTHARTRRRTEWNRSNGARGKWRRPFVPFHRLLLGWSPGLVSGVEK